MAGSSSEAANSQDEPGAPFARNSESVHKTKKYKANPHTHKNNKQQQQNNNKKTCNNEIISKKCKNQLVEFPVSKSGTSYQQKE